MIKEIIEEIDCNIDGFWCDGHIYITDDNRIIWSSASAPLHDCKPKPDYYHIFLKILKGYPGIRILREPIRKQIVLGGLLSIRRFETDRYRKKGYAKLLIQTVTEDTQLRGKISDIVKFSSFLPKKEIEENVKTAPIYFYKDNIVITQLYEQTPEGDIIEIIRESGAKIGAKGTTEFGNELISKLSFELSSEISEKAIIKSQITDTKKIAIITLYLVAYGGNAQDIMTFDLRNIPPYIFFDSKFIYRWSVNDDERKKYELISNVGPLNIKLTINENNIVHKEIFEQLKEKSKIQFQGLAKSDINSDGVLTLIPVYLAT